MPDIIITYKKGERHGFLHAVTKQGQEFLWDNTKGATKVNNRTMATAEEILAMIAKMKNVNVNAIWRK